MPGRLQLRALICAFTLGLVCGSCIYSLPDHCCNNEYDATCSALYGNRRPFCSCCEPEHDGCIKTRPLPEDGKACWAKEQLETGAWSLTE